MARYTGPKERISRALGTNLFLKGKRHEAGKSALVHKGRPRPGQHGAARHKVSEYGLRLREKQKLKFMYGVSEKQMRKYFDVAANSKGATDERYLQTLETRLDNVIYRLKFATTRAQARQLVGHGHVLVNGKRVDIPSFRVRKDMVIEVKESSKAAVRNNIEGFVGEIIPAWLTCDTEKLSGQMLSIPTKDEIDTNKLIQMNLIIEFYSR